VSLYGRYYSRFSRDPAWIQVAAAVGTAWALVDTAFNASWAYKVRLQGSTSSVQERRAAADLVPPPRSQWGVTYFIRPQDLARLPFELTAYCFIMSTAVLAVQGFYLYRRASVTRSVDARGAAH